MKKILAFGLSFLIFSVVTTDVLAVEPIISSYYDDFAQNSNYFYFAQNDNISCYDENFQNVWSNSFGGSSFDRFMSVAARDGMVVGAGYANSTDGDFEGMDIPEMFEPQGTESKNAYIVAFDPQSGDVLWSKVFGGGRKDEFLYVEILEETKEIYVVGTTTSGDCLLNSNEKADIYSCDKRAFYLIYDFDGNIIEKAQIPLCFSENLPNMNIRLVVKRTDLTKSYDEVFENDLSYEEYFEQFIVYCVDEYNFVRSIDKRIIYDILNDKDYYLVAGDRIFRNEYVSNENGEREYSLLTEITFDDIYLSVNEYSFNKLYLTGISYISGLDNGNFVVLGITVNPEISEFAPNGECAVMSITDSDLNVISTEYQYNADEYTILFSLGSNIYYGNNHSVLKDFDNIPENEAEIQKYYTEKVEDEFLGYNLFTTLFAAILLICLFFLSLVLIFVIYEKLFGAKAVKQRKARREMYLLSNPKSEKSIFIEYDYKALNTFIPFHVFSIVVAVIIHLKEILYNITRFGQYPGLKIYLSILAKIFIAFLIIVISLNLFKFVVSKIVTKQKQYKISKAVITKQDVIEELRKTAFTGKNFVKSVIASILLLFLTFVLIITLEGLLKEQIDEKYYYLVFLIAIPIYFSLVFCAKPIRNLLKK